MKIKILLFTILSVWMFSSCFKDEGNYDYTTLHPEFWGYVNSLTVYLGEEVEIHPIVSYGDLEDTTQVRFEWFIKDTIASTERVLRFKGTVVETINCDIVTIHPNGLAYVYYFQINVTSPYSLGWCLLYEDGGESELAHITTSTVTDEMTGETITKYNLYKDIYKNINGSSLGSEPIKIMEHYREEYKSNNQLLVIQRGGQGCVELDGASLQKSLNTVQEFIDEQPPLNFAPKDIVYLERFHFVWNGDGNIYTRLVPSPADGWHLTAFNNTPLYIEKGIRVDQILYSQYFMTDFVLLYDGLNKRLVPIGSRVATNTDGPGVLTMQEEYPEGFVDLTNFGDYELIYGSSCHDAGGSASENDADFSMLLRDANGQYTWQTFHVKFKKPNYYVTFPSSQSPVQEFTRGDLITEKTKYWLFKQRDYMFFTSGVNNDQLYYYDTNRGTIHLYKDFDGKEITAMHPNKGFTELGVGFADGTFKIFDVSEAVFISSQPKEIYSVDGIGKIVDVIYRYNKTGDHWK